MTTAISATTRSYGGKWGQSGESGVRVHFLRSANQEWIRSWREYDNNKGGKIDASDIKFSDLLIWQNKDADGVTDVGELKSLADVGIAAMDIKPRGFCGHVPVRQSDCRRSHPLRARG